MQPGAPHYVGACGRVHPPFCGKCSSSLQARAMFVSGPVATTTNSPAHSCKQQQQQGVSNTQPGSAGDTRRLCCRQLLSCRSYQLLVAATSVSCNPGCLAAILVSHASRSRWRQPGAHLRCLDEAHGGVPRLRLQVDVCVCREGIGHVPQPILAVELRSGHAAWMGHAFRQGAGGKGQLPACRRRRRRRMAWHGMAWHGMAWAQLLHSTVCTSVGPSCLGAPNQAHPRAGPGPMPARAATAQGGAAPRTHSQKRRPWRPPPACCCIHMLRAPLTHTHKGRVHGGRHQRLVGPQVEWHVGAAQQGEQAGDVAADLRHAHVAVHRRDADHLGAGVGQGQQEALRQREPGRRRGCGVGSGGLLLCMGNGCEV